MVKTPSELETQCNQLDCGKAVFEVSDNVFVMFRTDRHADRCRGNFGGCQLFRRKFGVRGGVRVNHEALHVGNVCKQAKDLQAIDELEGFFLAALDVEGENGTATVREVLLVKFVVRMAREARVAHAGNLRVLGKEFQNLLGVFHMAVETERKRFNTLQQEECVERGNGCTFVAEQNRTHVDGVGCGAGGHKRESVARVLFGELRELAALGPVELAAIHNHAAESRSMTTDELGGRMHHDIGTVFNRANQVRRTEGVVDHQRNLVLVGDFGDGIDIRNVGMRVAECFDKDELRVFLDSGFNSLQVMGIYEGRFDTEVAERVLQQVESTTVNSALDNHVVSAAGKSRDGVSDGCGTGSDGESGNATFEGSDTFFENALGRIGDAAVDVTGVLQGETVSGMLSAMEHVGSGLVDGNCARIGCGICMFLANVNLESFKMELVLCRHG